MRSPFLTCIGHRSSEGCAGSRCTTVDETVRLLLGGCDANRYHPSSQPRPQRRTAPAWPIIASADEHQAKSLFPVYCHLAGLLRPRKDSNLRLRFRNAVEWVSASHFESHLTCSASVVSSSGLVEHHAVARSGWTSGWTTFALDVFRLAGCQPERWARTPAGRAGVLVSSRRAICSFATAA